MNEDLTQHSQIGEDEGKLKGGEKDTLQVKKYPSATPNSVQEGPWKQVLIKCSGLLRQNASLIPTNLKLIFFELLNLSVTILSESNEFGMTL